MPAVAPGPLRTIFAGLVGGVTWIAAMTFLFGLAQAILTDPDYQSAKFLDVIGRADPPPRMMETPWILPAGLLLLGVISSIAYRIVRQAFAGDAWWRKGLRFGALAWLLMVPWFEFYLPWNVMREPLLLAILESLLWLGVLLATGLAIALIQEWPIRRQLPGTVRN